MGNGDNSVGLFDLPFPPTPPTDRRRSRRPPSGRPRLIPADADGARALAQRSARRRHPSAGRTGRRDSAAAVDEAAPTRSDQTAGTVGLRLAR